MLSMISKVFETLTNIWVALFTFGFFGTIAGLIYLGVHPGYSIPPILMEGPLWYWPLAPVVGGLATVFLAMFVGYVLIYSILGAIFGAK